MADQKSTHSREPDASRGPRMQHPSLTPQPYRDRGEAGRKLAARLEHYRPTRPLVLGIPRGGVPVASEVARLLGADLDVVVARKLGAPQAPEFAIGATTANGGLVLDTEAIVAWGISPEQLELIIAREREEARSREERFRGDRLGTPIAGRTVIVVDDGLATGATMRAAVRSVQQGGPRRVVVAVPVGSRSACAALRGEVDEVVCLWVPEPFFAVGLYYENFEPTPDTEVQRLLGIARESGVPRS